MPAKNPASARSGLDRPEQQDDSHDHHDQAGAHDRADHEAGGEARAECRGHEHGHGDGQHLLAGLQGIQPEHQLQVEGDDEEDTHQDQVLAEESEEPGAQSRDLDEVQMDERVVVGRLAPVLPADEAPQQRPAERNDEQRRRQPEELERRVLRLDPTPGARLQHTENDRSEPGRRQHGPHDVEVRPRLRLGRVRHEAGHDQDEDDQHHFAGEDDPPGQFGGRPAAEDGPDRDARTGDTADHRVGDLSRLSGEVAPDERGQRREHQSGAETLEDRPADRQHRHALGARGQRRATPVDHQTDREGPPPADHVADLGARHHEHGHDQAVEGDHRLDRRNRRVEVVHQRADRHIHDRLVEDHDELGGGEGYEGHPFDRRRSLPALHGSPFDTEPASPDPGFEPAHSGYHGRCLRAGTCGSPPAPPVRLLRTDRAAGPVRRRRC